MPVPYSTQIAPDADQVGDIPIDVPFAGAAGSYGAAPDFSTGTMSRTGSFRQGLFDATSEPWLF